MKFSIITLGCSKNTVDSENIAALLIENDNNYVNDLNNAEIVIVNTCAFILDAKKESIDTILELKELKNEKNIKIIVLGCLSQRYKDELLSLMPEIDFIIGTGDLDNILNIFKSIKENKALDKNQVGDVQHQFLDNTSRWNLFKHHTRYVKISEGCDNHCSYCIIPALRGKYKSRPIEEILIEIENMTQNGAKEIILIAQDTSKYGIDLYKECKLYELIKEISNIEAVKWIRIHYLYPESIDNKIISAFKDFKKLVPYIDMPIQHINDNMLLDMKRSTNSLQIRALIKTLRKEIPGVVLRTSLITGFPGETEEMFKEMLNFIKEVKFERLGVFAFSEEEGTKANLLPNKIDEEVKNHRQEQLMLIQSIINEEYNKKMLDKTIDVIIDNYIDNNIYIGRTYMDSLEVDQEVEIKSTKPLQLGDIIPIKIIETEVYGLKGVVL